MQRPLAIILDRDGVINFDSPDYILSPEQWQPIPGSLEAIARLTAADIPVTIASNQSALGRGMIDQATFEAIHTKMMHAIEQAGGAIVHIAYCPHGPDDACDCRKPKAGLVLECLDKLGLSNMPEKALMIGDSFRDVQAAHGAGVPAVLVQTGYGDAGKILAMAREVDPQFEAFPDLASAVDWLLG